MSRRPILCVVDQNLKDLVGHHFEYDRAAAEGASAQGFDPVCLGHRDAVPAVTEALPFRPAFSCGMWWLPEEPSRERAIEAANRHFLGELDAAVAPLGLDGSSLVFAHMIVHGQLSAWARFVEQRLGATGPQVVLLLRYQPSFYRGPSCEAAFRSLERSVADGARVRLASDSARLSAQLERLTRLPVETFPIPHTSEAHGGGPRAPGPLRVVSLGNARDEKGILELFDAARILELRGDGQGLELVLQANDPHPEIAPAVERFAMEPPPNVRLVRQALSTEAYAGLLASADIVATPYWRDIYEARTSGVFLEAVAAGKPVICTAETWMADELARAGGGAGVVTRDRDPAALAAALIEARDRFAELSVKAAAERLKWRAFHNPGRFAEVLVHGAPPAERPLERRAAVLFPWGDDLVDPATGAANRVKPVIDLLGTRYTSVRVLQDVDRAARRIGPVSYEPIPLLQRAEGRGWYKFLRAVLRMLGAQKGEEIYPLLHLVAARDPDFLARLDEIVAWADLVLLEYPFWAEAVRAACMRHGKGFVLTSHDVISDQCRGSWPVRRIARALERRALRSAPRRLALSPSDAATFESWGFPTEVVPIGLDLDRLRARVPGNARALMNARLSWPEDDDTPLLLFIGSKFRPNVLAVENLIEIASRLAAHHPDAPVRIVVAGACCEPQVRDGFVALGGVDALTAHLLRQEASLMLAPLTLGTGVSVKAFEALGAGAALLSTRVGVRGIPGVEEAVEIEDDLGAWPDRIARLVASPARLDELRERARRFSEAMDYRETYAVYLDAGGGRSVDPIRPDPRTGDHAAFLVGAAAAAMAVRQPSTAAACVTEALQLSPRDSAALIVRARLAVLGHGDGETGLDLLDEALREGADPEAVLRTRADLLGSAASADAEQALKEAARFRVSRAISEGREPSVRDEAWRAYHNRELDWALALALEGALHWPGSPQRLGDYDYLCADLLKTRDVPAGVVEQHVERALAGGFDPFWCHMIMAEVHGRRGADRLRVASLHAAIDAAGPDTERMLIALNALIASARIRQDQGDLLGAKALALELTETRVSGSAFYLLGEIGRAENGPAAEIAACFASADAAGFAPGWSRTHRARLKLDAGEFLAALDLGCSALRAPGPDHRRDAVDVICGALWALYDSNSAELARAVVEASATGLLDGRLAYLQGEVALREGRRAQAGEAYTAALETGFDPYWCYRRRAEARRGLGLEDLEDRLAAAGLAVDEDGRLSVLAPVLTGSGRPLGEDICERVLAVDPQSAALAALVEQARRSEAVADPEPEPQPEPELQPEPEPEPQAEPEPLPPPCISNDVRAAWRVFEDRDYERTLKLAARLVRSGRGDRVRSSHGHYLSAECLQILERRLNEAERHYDMALQFGFDPYWVRFNRAQLHRKLGREREAVEDLEAALAEASTDEQRQAASDSLAFLTPRLADA